MRGIKIRRANADDEINTEDRERESKDDKEVEKSLTRARARKVI